MKKYSIKLNILFGQKISDDYGDKYIKIEINFDDNLHLEKKFFFNDKNEYYPWVFSEECLYEFKKYFEIITMNVTSTNKSSKNEKKEKKNILLKKKKRKEKKKEESMD